MHLLTKLLYLLAIGNEQNMNPLQYCTTVKPVLSSPSKIGKTKGLKTDGSLIQVETIAECSTGGAFCNTFDLH